MRAPEGSRHEILLPEVEGLAELYGRGQEVPTFEQSAIRPPPVSIFDRRILLSSFCGAIRTSHRGRIFGWVLHPPRALLVDTLRAHLTDLDFGYEEQVFPSLVERGDGTVLMTVSYNSIIGSRWVALFPSIARAFAGLDLSGGKR